MTLLDIHGYFLCTKNPRCLTPLCNSKHLLKISFPQQLNLSNPMKVMDSLIGNSKIFMPSLASIIDYHVLILLSKWVELSPYSGNWSCFPYYKLSFAEYWVQAFQTAAYLINRMPTRVLNFKSPYECLHGRHPNYSLLRVFGSSCYPFLRPVTAQVGIQNSEVCLLRV